MRIWVLRLFVVGLLVLVALPAGLSARAQDGSGLSDDQLALLERVRLARENYQAYTSLVEDVTGGQSRELILTAGDNRQSRSTLVTWQRSSQIIREETGANIAATATATIIDSGTGVSGQVNSRTRTLNVELRKVDGKVYLQAAYGADTTPGSELPALPEGWFEVESLQDWPVLQELELQDLVEQHSMFDDFDVVKAAVSDVAVAPGTLADGTPADAITLTFDAAGLQTLFGAGPTDPVMAQVLQNLADDSSAVLTVTVDANDNLRESIFEMVLHATGLDGSMFGFDRLPAGAILDFTNELTRHEVYSQINEPFEPASVPEALAQ
jgi:hypothetical protein